MKTKIFAVVLLASFAALPGAASAKGCLKGAAVGGVGGHQVRGNEISVDAAGCAVGQHRARNRSAEASAARVNTAPAASAPATAR
jgi:hypothetical protein